ncbi:SRPBCC family protein [Ruicaihuangia caeni]|uniref:SRPBCC domain-containing protein n=1 Tax=Ruicaihuangia caeni TaxID=3042517 RepID=A0AAW6T952_9MICO|nr:SRPBCC domain-containing protein [Klugiella sp. YN-L-19]MDI2098298.1 SRPBCC domain-containing protein [Klugiella sp. YN-L-19]
MTVTAFDKDVDSLTLTFVVELPIGMERAWQFWADPRTLERWWGPPSWPATVTQHDFVPGGSTRYFMTGPDGDTSHGWWTITELEPPRLLAFEDGFSDVDGTPIAEMPTTRARVTFEPLEAGTRMTIASTCASREQFDQLIHMGVEEGMTQALSQLDALIDEEVAREE